MNENLTHLVNKLQDILSVGEYPDSTTLVKLKSEIDSLAEVLNSPAPRISEVSGDFYAIYFQLQEYVKKKDTWKDFQVSSTGRTLLEIISALGAFLQTSIFVAFNESFLHTANRDSSIYALTRSLGVKIARKTPSKVKIWLKRIDDNKELFIPAYTPFSVNGLEYFNDVAINFPIGESILPINIDFDENGLPVKKDSLVEQVYTADIVFPDEGKIYYPCSGIVSVSLDTAKYYGKIQLIDDKSNTDSVFGSIIFKDSVILSSALKYEIELDQYNGTKIKGQLIPKSNSAYLRFPANIAIQIKRTGIGASILTPALGIANFPKNSVIITGEPYEIVKNKYLIPEYLDKAILSYDTDLFLHNGRIAILEHTVLETKEFYSIALNNPGFVVSNDHIYVEVFDGVNITIWSKADKPLWQYSSDSTVFTDSTLGNGDAILTFGNGIHGKRLEAGWVVGIRYVLTKGSSGNIGANNLEVVCPSFSLIGGTLTPSYGGADEKSASYYKEIAPSIFKSKNRAVTLEDHESILLDYPNVADVKVLNQKDVAPYDLRYMNRISLVLLPKSPSIKVYPPESLMSGQLFDPAITNPKDAYEPNKYKFSDLEIQDFKVKFSKVSFSALDVDFGISPIPLPIKVKVRAFVYKQYSLDSVSAKISIAIKNLFERRPGILGRSLLLSDILNACKFQEIDFIEILNPSFNVILGDSLKDKCSFICLDSYPEISTEYSSRRSYNA